MTLLSRPGTQMARLTPLRYLEGDINAVVDLLLNHGAEC